MWEESGTGEVRGHYSASFNRGQMIFEVDTVDKITRKAPMGREGHVAKD